MSDRRSFLKTALAGTAAAGFGKLSANEAADRPPEVKPVDRRPFGRTGVPVSILGLGLGSSFTRPYRGNPKEGRQLLEAALGHGINVWDTCRGYGPSEDLIGPLVEKHRKEIYLITKSGGRDYDRFMRDVETSLNKLKTDHLELLHMWNLKANEDLDRMEKGCFKAVRELKEQNVIDAYGITGHSGADVLVNATQRFDPDALLTVFPCTRSDNGKYEDELLPLAREKQMGVFAMKTVRYARGADLRGSDLIRYALSLEGVHSAVVGVDTLAHLNENMVMSTDFVPMPEKKRAELHRTAVRVLAGVEEPWSRAGYQDGAPG